VGPPHPPSSDQPASDESEGTGVRYTPLRAAISFTEQLLTRVQGFTCGDSVWAREVAEWIQGARGTGGALDDMVNLQTQVWLYEAEDGNLVGFASLGETLWRYPHPSKSDQRRVLIIPNYAMALAYHGKPPGPKDQRYSRQIFADLLRKAEAHPSGLKVIGLVVHPDNQGAILLYQDFNFRLFGKPRKDGYLRMVATLPEEVRSK
jgi:hypothetical protein